MPKFISDEAMAQMEVEEKAKRPKKFISDDEMARLEQDQPVLKDVSKVNAPQSMKDYRAMIEEEKVSGNPQLPGYSKTAFELTPEKKISNRAVEDLPYVLGIIPGAGGVGEYLKEKIKGEETNPGQIAYQTAISALPIALPVAKKAAGKVLDAVPKIQKWLSKSPAVGTGKTITTPSDMLETLSNEQSQFKLTPEMEAQNKTYQEMGLDPLTAAQQQTKIPGEPTPAQITETLLKARDQELYNQQLEQSKKYEKLLDQYRNLGHPNPEVASQEIMEKIYGENGKLKEVGEKVGAQIKPIENEPIDPIKEIKIQKKLAPKQEVYSESQIIPEASEEAVEISRPAQIKADISKVQGKILKEDMPIVDTYKTELENAKTYGDLMNLNSKIAQTKEKRELGSAAESALDEIKRTAKSKAITKMKEIGIKDPEIAYEQYATATAMLNKGGVIQGVDKLGHEKDLIAKVTRTGSTVEEFKDTVTKLGSPELMTTVKENWLSELFKKNNWVSEWNKYKNKTDVVNKLLSKEDIKKIDLIAQYKGQMESTMTKTVNPSRSGVLGFFQRTLEKPVSAMIQYIIGDEIKMSRALYNYKKLTGQLKKENILTPGRVKGSATFETGRMMYNDLGEENN